MSRQSFTGLAIVAGFLLYTLAGAWLVEALGRAYRADWLERSRASLTARLIEQPREPGGGPDRSPASASISAVKELRADPDPDPVLEAVTNHKEPTATAPAVVTASNNPVAAESVDSASRAGRSVLTRRGAGAPSFSPIPIPSPESGQSPAIRPPLRRTRETLATTDRDPTRLSVDEELRVGQAVRAMIRQRHPEINQGRLREKLDHLIQPLLADRKRKEIEYRLILLDGESVNAFSHLGGMIYVSRGLAFLAASDAEFQFVLAREVAHLDEKHSGSRVLATQAQLRQEGRPEDAEDLPRLVFDQIAQGYTEDQDLQADEWAFLELKRLDRFDREILTWLNKLVGYQPAPARALDAEFDRHLLTQPPASMRFQRLRSRSATSAR